MVSFKVLLISCPPDVQHFPLPPGLAPRPTPLNLRNFAELRVSIPQQIQLHQQTRQPRKPCKFMDSFLDQIDKVQGPAALTPSPAAHQQAPGMQQHLSSVPIGTEEPGEPFRGREVGEDDT